MGLYNPIACPRAANVQLQSPPNNIVTLRTAKLRHRDTCRLTVPHTTPWHGHHGPRHPFPDNDDPWPTAVRECLNQCADEHLHYCRREQEPSNHPGWRDALVHLFHTTGTRDLRLRLFHPTRAKQDAHTGLRVNPDGLHLHFGGYRRRGGLSPPTRGRRTTRRQPSCTSSATYSRKESTKSLTRTWHGPSPCAPGPTRRRRCGW